MSLKDLAKLIREETKEKDVSNQFLYDLTKTIEMEDSLDTRKPSTKFKPSSLGLCKRSIFFEVKGTEPDGSSFTDYQLIGMGESGTSRHEKLQEYIMKMRNHNFECEWIDVDDWIRGRKPAGTTIIGRKGNEVKCYNEIYNMSFLCDGIIKYKGQYYILELKTETSYKFNNRVEIAEEHIVQGTCYSTCLGIDKVIFVYENRDVLNKKAYLLEVTDDMKNDLVLSTIEYICDCIDNDNVPVKTEHKKYCNNCSYTEECKKW